MVDLERDAPGLAKAVAEAIDALGYFRADAAAELTEMFGRCWGRANSDTMLIYGNDSEDMTRAEKEAAGLDRGRMPREVWNIMSAKGRSRPAHAVKATGLRVDATVRREWERRRGKLELEVYRTATFRAAAETTCAAARALNDRDYPVNSRFQLPLRNCDAEWCNCSWIGAEMDW